MRGPLFIPILQTVILLACIGAVTLLGIRGIIDAPAITAIVGAIVGSVGVLAGVNMAHNGQRTATAPEKGGSPEAPP